MASVGVRQANASPRDLRQHAPILIDGPGNFTAGNGVTGGSGSPSDPYIIQGWSIDASNANGIEIRNIVSESPPFFVIRNVLVHSETLGHFGILVDTFDSPPGCFECPANFFPGVIANSTLAGNGVGIMLQDSDNIFVSGVTVHDSQTGIDCVNSAFIQIRANIVTDSGTGINVFCSIIDVFYNTVLDSDNGIVVGHNASIDIEHNYVTSPRGFSLEGSGDLILANNKIVGSSGPTVRLYQYGIAENQTENVSVQNNTITNTMSTDLRSGPAGINITSSGSPFVVGNTVEAGSSYGIVLHDAFGATVYHNNILNNTFQAFDDNPSQNTWDNGYPSGGNFWSDFTGVDNCSGPQQNICPGPDGIGDTPYVFSSNTDHYPLMRPFQ